jgi:hypothetical protein
MFYIKEYNLFLSNSEKSNIKLIKDKKQDLLDNISIKTNN